MSFLESLGRVLNCAKRDEAGRLAETVDVVARKLEAQEALIGKLRRQLAEARAELGNPPGLSSAEIERLAWLMEECGEVIHAAGKVLRFGYESQPPKGGPMNRVYLEREMGNVCSAIEYMIGTGDVRGGDVRHWARRKNEFIDTWLRNQG